MADDLMGALTAVVAVATLPLGVLAFLFAGWKLSVVVFVVGWLLLTPLIPIVGKELLPAVREPGGNRESDEQTADPLEELKRRYACGEISDEEFERQVGNLVETEDVRIDTDAGIDDLDGREGATDADDREADDSEADDRDLDRLRE